MQNAAVLLLLLAPTAAALRAATRSRRASVLLRKEGYRLQSPQLTSLAQMLVEQPQGLDNVKDMISHMLAQKMAAHAEDTTQKEFCDKEVAASEKKVEEYKESVEEAQADLEMANAKRDQLAESVSEHSQYLAKAANSVAEATALRQQEQDRFEQDKIENEQSAAAMTSAMGLIGHHPGLRAVLEVAQEATIKNRISDESSEQDRQMQYDNMMKDLEVDKATKTQMAENQQRQIVSLKVDISDHERDIRTSQDELRAAQDYAAKIRSQCLTNPEGSHEERQERRNDEINSLRDAYGILTGTDAPALA